MSLLRKMEIKLSKITKSNKIIYRNIDGKISFSNRNATIIISPSLDEFDYIFKKLNSKYIEIRVLDWETVYLKKDSIEFFDISTNAALVLKCGKKRRKQLPIYQEVTPLSCNGKDFLKLLLLFKEYLTIDDINFMKNILKDKFKSDIGGSIDISNNIITIEALDVFIQCKRLNNFEACELLVESL